MESSSAAPRPARRSRLWRITLYIVSGGAFLLAAAVLTENVLGARALRQARAAWAAAGESLEAADVLPPPIPDAQNLAAAPMLAPLFDYELERSPLGKHEHAFRNPEGVERIKSMVNDFKHLDGLHRWLGGSFVEIEVTLRKLPRVSAPAQADERPAAAYLRYLQPIEADLETLRVAAAERPKAQLPLRYSEGFPMSGARYDLFMRLPRILSSRAVAKLALGDSEGALADIELVLRLVELCDAPLLIHALVQHGAMMSAWAPIWEGLARHQFTDPQLARLNTALAWLDFLRALRTAVHGETIFAQRAMVDAMRNPKVLLSAGQDAAWAPLLWLVPRGVYDFNRANLLHWNLDFMQAIDARGRRVDAMAVRHLDQEVALHYGTHRPHSMLAATVYGGISHAAVPAASCQGYVDLARCAIALERARLKHGHYPATLSALAPEFMTAIPNDLITGAPLRYQLTPEGDYRLYSTGWDGADQGGEIAWRFKSSRDKPRPEEGDWAWPRPAK